MFVLLNHDHSVNHVSPEPHPEFMYSEGIYEIEFHGELPVDSRLQVYNAETGTFTERENFTLLSDTEVQMMMEAERQSQQVIDSQQNAALFMNIIDRLEKILPQEEIEAIAGDSTIDLDELAQIEGLLNEAS